MAHVTRAVAAISQKLNSLANFDGVESKVNTFYNQSFKRF